ncbi:hypothetical protein IMCC26256_112071 [Actinobacteria bacterium IMCC26256]|nr:hypothetical protein IMCC26256_112071 [Actinobacteria bacterium IMCC26256]
MIGGNDNPVGEGFGPQARVPIWGSEPGPDGFFLARIVAGESLPLGCHLAPKTIFVLVVNLGARPLGHGCLGSKARLDSVDRE